MSTDTKRPKIELGPGGIYYYTDPATGQTHTSPSYNGLRQDLEDAAQARARADKREADYHARTAERKADGAARLAELTPRLEAAQAERDRAWSTFRQEALEGGAYVEAYARWVVAHRRADALRIVHGDARHAAAHGQDRRGAPGEARTPPLSEALDRLVTDRADELRATPAED